jgi:hypothetical protein
MYCAIGRPVELIFRLILLKCRVHPSKWHISESQKNICLKN